MVCLFSDNSILVWEGSSLGQVSYSDKTNTDMVHTPGLNSALRYRVFGRGRSSGATMHLKGNGMIFLLPAQIILIMCCRCWPPPSVLVMLFSSRP